MIQLLTAYGRALGLLRSEWPIATMLLVANVAIAVISIAEALLFGWVVDSLAKQESAINYVLLWAGLGIIGIAASVLVSLYADRLSHRQRVGVMTTAFEQAMTMPLTYLAQQGAGKVVRSMLTGADTLFALWLSFFREYFLAIISLVFLIPTALSVDWSMTAVLAILAVVYTVANLLIVKRTEGDQSQVELYNQEVFGRVGDVVGNMTVVHAYSRLRNEAEELREMTRQLLRAQFPVLFWWAVLTVLQRAASTIAMVVIIGWGSMLNVQGKLTVGEIVAFVGFAGLLISRLDQLAGFVARLFTQVPMLHNIFDLLEAKGAVSDTPGATSLGDEVKGSVAFDRVSYRFPGSTIGIHDVSFRAEAGQTVALVGPTGSGKTTLLALLQRLRDPDEGTIAIDDQDIRGATLVSLRHAMAVVFQDAGLFNRSIRENLAIGKPGATDEEIEQAARAAEAWEFIQRKEGDLDFLIGERGAYLSGGERQRLAIARAILRDAPILVLDEATSALDNITEARVKKALDTARKGRTTFIIAHRLSTIVDANLILVLERGRVVEAGTFDQLVARGGFLAEMVRSGSIEGSAASREAQGSVPHAA